MRGRNRSGRAKQSRLVMIESALATAARKVCSCRHTRYGPDSWRSTKRRPGSHVVIRVRATSFNYHDVFTVRGMPGIKVPMPMIIGLDIAGEILEVGSGVSGWKKGDRVLVNPLNPKVGLMGEMMHGGLAEKCLVAEHQLIHADIQVP